MSKRLKLALYIIFSAFLLAIFVFKESIAASLGGPGNNNPYQFQTTIANTYTTTGTVNQVGGILKGFCVQINGGTENNPEYGIADITDESSLPVRGVSVESANNGETIRVIESGLLKNFDTSSFILGQKVYAGDDGDIVGSPSDSSNGIAIIGTVTKVDASTGEIDINIINFTFEETFNGTVAVKAINSSDGANAVAGFSSENDLGHETTIGITGSGHSITADSGFIFSDGFGPMVFYNDGNKSFEWFADIADTHAGIGTVKMKLFPDGILNLGAVGVYGGKETTTPTAITDNFQIYSKTDNEFYFQDGSGVEHIMADQPFASHDLQGTMSSTPQTVSSTTYVDVTSASITANDLGEDGTYMVDFSASVKFTDDEETLTFRLQPGNIEKVVTVKESDGNAYMIYNELLTGIDEDEIKLEVKISASTASILNYNFRIFGTPEGSIVQ